MQTGGVDPQATASNVQQLDLDLKEGETLTIVVNATVKPPNIKPTKNEPYAPKVSSLPRSTAAKKRA